MTAQRTTQKRTPTRHFSVARKFGVRMNHKIGLFVASGHPLFLEGMRMILRNDPSIQLVGAAQHLTDTVEEVRRLRPHVVFLDLPMTEQSSADHDVLNAISRMKEGDRELQIFVLTISGRLQSVEPYRKAGASGSILPETRLEQIWQRIRASHRSDAERNISSAIAGRRGPCGQKANKSGRQSFRLKRESTNA